MTNLQLHLQKAKQLGVKFTVLATSISLAACGGGGSDGFYNNTGSGTGTNTGTPPAAQTKEATGISLTLSKDQLNVKGDELTVTAKAVDKDGGGVVGKKINLNITNALTLGATSDASEKTTDEKGEVTFTVKLSGTNQSAQELLLTTTLVGTTINNVRKVTVSGTSTVVQSQYEVKFDTPSNLKVTGGEAAVRVRAVDANGGGVPNQDVVLAIKNFSAQNDVSIKGVSNGKTDNDGYATFTVQLAKGTEASRAALIQSGVPLVATLTEQNGATKTQVSTLNVASVANLVTGLTVSTNNGNKVDAVDGTIDVVVNAKNPEGLAVANQNVTLALDEQAVQYGAKLVASTAKTDANGNATFTVKTETNSLNPTGQLLVQNGITTTATLQASDGSTVTAQTTKVTVVSTITDEVSYLTVSSPDQIEIKGGQAVVTVTAVDKNGGALANKKIVLAVKNSAQNGIVIKEGSQQTTDASGRATFTLQFNATGLTSTTLANLLANGVDVGVAYAKASGGTVSQTTRVQFYTKQVQSPAIDRLEMSVSKGVVNASNDTVEIKVRAIDEKGNAAANQSVKFELTVDATQNGVKFDGASSKVTDANGYVSYTLHTTAANADAIDKLIQSGITAKSTSGTTSQTIQVMVQAAAAETVAVSYLSMSADSLININKGQAKVTVKAVDSNGGVLSGRVITLKIADSQKNGLTLNASKIQTDGEGKATFTIAYDGSITDQNLLTQLKNAGVLLTAEYQPTNGVSSIPQTTRVRYYEQNINADVQQLAISLSKGVAVASNDTITATVKAVDENGQPVVGRKISLALSDVAKNNGVTLIGGSVVSSNSSGEAVFTLKLAAINTDAINALTTAGVILTASAEQSNESPIVQTSKLMVAATAQAQVDVSYLALDSVQSVEVAQSTERQVKVKAFNSSGAVIANKDISLALSKTINGIGIKEGNKLTTNASGEVVFTLTYNAGVVSQADKAVLQTQGLGFTATYSNNQGAVVNQTSSLAFYALPVNIAHMDLLVDQGVLVINSIASKTVNTKAVLKDAQGNPVVNRQVTLALDNTALQNGVGFAGVTGGFAVVSTDVKGEASIALTIAPTTAANINTLVASGIGIGASAVQGDGIGIITQSNKVNVLSEAAVNEVASLSVTTDNSIATTGGSAKITVVARNSDGATLKDKLIKLNLATTPAGLNIKLDAASKITDGTGTATFDVTYIAGTGSAGLSAEQIKALLAGIVATATYTNSAGTNTTQATTVQFYTDEVNIARIDLLADQGALVVNTSTNTTLKALIALKDSAGNPVKNRQVIIAVDNVALINGVSIVGASEGSIAVSTDTAGLAQVTLKVTTDTAAKVAALVASGIGIGASAVQGDGSGVVTQNTKVNVLSEAAINEVGYLTTTASDSISTAGGFSDVIVKAFNKDGTVLKDKAISLKLNNVPAGLNVKVNPANATTGSAGAGATFTVTYTKPATGGVTAEQIKALLAGINAVATYTNSAGTNITQSTIIQFTVDDTQAATDIQRLELLTSKGLARADSDTVTLTVKATNSSGAVAANKTISLGLSLAASENGVSAVSLTALTNAQGIATFTLNVNNIIDPTTKKLDEQKIKNLVANGIDIAVATVSSDGTTLVQNTKVMAQSPESANPSVASLQITPSKQTVSTLGDSTDIVILAVDKDGNALKDKKVSFKLADNLSSRLSVDEPTATTNSNGFVTFKVTVAPGTDPVGQDLLQSGITFAVSTANGDSPIPVTQVGKINVTVPQESTNLTISSSKPTLLASGDTAEIYTKLVDQSTQPVKNSLVALTVIDSALNGVTIDGANNAITDASGNAKFNIKLTKITGAQYQALLSNGVTVRASITLSNGVVRSQDVHLNVNEAISQYHLTILPDTNSLSVDGDSTLVAVTLLDAANQPVKNKQVTLIARNIAGGVLINGVDVAITTTPQTVTTDEAGRGFFRVTIPTSGFDKGLLEKSNIVLDASYIETNGAVTTQVELIDVFTPPTSPSQTQPARYSLRISSAKPTLNVRNDISDVTVTLVDENGGGVSGKYVTLSLADFTRNGASIFGASGLTTDANGQAVFKVKVDETARAQTYPAANFAADNLNLTAKYSETGYFDATQINTIDVVQAVIAQPVASIVIGVNPTEVASSNDGVYYTRNMSASVVDFDGKPLANQEVALDITPLTYTKGGYSFDVVTDFQGNQSQKWVYHDTISCAASAAGTAITNAQVTNIPVKVPTFLGQGATATYTTDAQGKFDFTIRYPKIYAQWLNVRIGAASTVSTLPTRTVYDLGLPSLASDYSTDGTYGPNLTSPYGTNFTCP